MSERVPSATSGSGLRNRAVAVVLLFLTVLAFGSWWSGRDLRSSAGSADNVPAVSGARLFDQVASAVAHRFVDSLDVSDIYERAVNGLLRELHDPHTAYLTGERLQRLDEQITGVYAGVGLQFDSRDGVLVVLEPMHGSPAERAGIQGGDRVVEVGGESTVNWSYSEAARAIRGRPGTSVSIIVDRGGQRLPFSLIREAVHVKAVSRIAILPEHVGYIDVNVFGQHTLTELEAAVDSVVALGAQSLVLDLRGNPGGLLEQGVAVAELFLDSGQVVVELRGRPETEPQSFADSSAQRWPSMPLSVLIDKGTASASEIVAGALQDHDRAIVVGSTSFGKGSAQSVFPLPNGGGLRLTTARWYTPVGRSISAPIQVPADVSEDYQRRIAPKDTVKPKFRTDAGRTVYGGGGITPDVQSADTVTPVPVLILARAMGSHFGEYRDALTKLARSLHSSGAIRSAEEAVTSVMLDSLYSDLQSRDVAPGRAIFDAAAPWIARSLGYEMARVAFGADAEFYRRAQEDVTLQRATSLLSGARTPSEVFARVEGRQGVEVPIPAVPHSPDSIR